MTSADQLRGDIRTVMATTFGMPPGKLPAGASVQTLPAWDSLGHLALIEALGACFKVTIPVRDAVDLLTEDDLVRYLSTRVG